MKNRHTLPLFFLLRFAVALTAFASLTSCMRNASLTVLQPAEMKLPEHISVVAVIDRSKPSNGWLNVLEGVLTGEAIGQDRRSREEAVAGLTNSLTKTPRFRVKNTGIELTGAKAGVNLPAPLDWREIEKICGDYGADAVVAIESFDSNNSTSTRKNESKTKDKEGKEVTTISWDSRQRTAVRMGWRMYDPRTKIILDEFTTDDYLERTGSGKTERAALDNLPSQVLATRDVAYIAGQHYGMRIAPVYVNVSRSYYYKAKGFKPGMKEASRHAQAGSWDKAATIWQAVVNQSGDNRKAAGRAQYNMAVAAEMQGDLEKALDLAQTAWTKYGNKQARSYIQTIKNRQNDARKVEYQMNKKV